jgi:outer membrane protein assembly factor BamB
MRGIRHRVGMWHLRGELRAFAVVATAGLLLAGCDWTAFRYSPAHTGFNSTESTISVGNVSGLAVLFTGAIGGSAGSSPAVANGKAYVGSNDGKLYAFDAAGSTNCSGSPTTCTPLWTAATGDIVISSPVVTNGVVYVGSGDGRLYAFDAAGTTNCSGSPTTCAPLWTATTVGPVSSSLAVANGRVYAASGGLLYTFVLP